MPDPTFARRTIARASAGRRRQAGLEVSVTDELGRRVAAPGLARWLQRVAPARSDGVVTIALVSDARIRALNRTYRRKDRATDVLSFPSRERRPASGEFAVQDRAPSRHRPAPGAKAFLGDIAIARGVASRQAREAGHSAAVELRVLALHGLLHLLGYDHERDAGRMRRVERRLRRKGGLREGLIERARPGSR
jgi:probable rRNA maturation factor